MTDAFGEIFRMLSYDQVGAAAMLSRATAGVYRGKLIFSTPGMVRLATLRPLSNMVRFIMKRGI